MPDVTNKITQEVELKPVADKAASNKVGQDIGDSVEKGIDKGIEKGAESGADKASKTISKAFSSAASTSIRDAIANSGSMKGKRAAAALAMPTSRDYALAKKRVGSGRNEGENEAINAAKGKVELFETQNKRLTNAEKSSQRKSVIRTGERELASRHEREAAAKGELANTQAAAAIRTAEAKKNASIELAAAKAKIDLEAKAQNRANTQAERAQRELIKQQTAADEKAAKQREAELAARERLQALQDKSVSDSVRYNTIRQGRNYEDMADYKRLTDMYKSMEGRSAAENAKTYGGFEISDAMKAAEHAWSEIANWFDNNQRDSAGQANYSALTNMYRGMQGMGASGVRSEYGGFSTEDASSLHRELLNIVALSPQLAQTYASVRGIFEQLKQKVQSPIVEALSNIKEGAQESHPALMQCAAAVGRLVRGKITGALSAIGKGFGKLKDGAKKATSALSRFGNVLVWRIYRVAAMKTLQAVAAGFKHLSEYSQQFGTQFYTNMQEMKTSIQFVGNAFAAMVAPILNFVLPILRRLADEVANIFNRIGQSIASALGQSQYSAALRTMVSDSKKAGGKMKDILGFDELNRLSGDTGAGEDSSRMFEEWGAEPDGSAVNALADAWERVKAAMEQVGQAFAPIGEALLGLATNLLPIIADLIGTIAEAIAPILVAVAPAIEAIVSSIAPLVGAALPAINTLLGTLSPFITRIVGVISNIVQAVMPGLVAIMGVVADVMEIIITLASPILDIIATVIETVGGVLTPIIDTLTAAIELVKEIIDPIVPVVKGIVSVISSVLNPILEVVKGIITGLASVISAVLIVAIKLVQAAIAGLSPVIEKIGALFSGLAEGIKTGWQKVKDFVQNAMKNISAAWESIKRLVSKGGEVFNGIKEGIAKAFGTVVNAVIRGINWIIARPFDAINSALAKIRDISILGYEPFKDKIRLISVPQIPLLQLASGGAVANAGRLDGTLINVNEAGPEVVANQGRSTGVMNTDQMKAAIAEGNVNVVEAIYTMMASVVSAVNNKDLDVYLDAQKVGRSVTNYQNNYARQYGV